MNKSKVTVIVENDFGAIEYTFPEVVNFEIDLEFEEDLRGYDMFEVIMRRLKRLQINMKPLEDYNGQYGSARMLNKG